MGNTEWKEKAEKFLESHLDDNNYNAEEAAVYFLSRGKNYENISKTINDAIERWRNDKTRWSEECRRNPTRAASTLRLMQWGEIGALQKYRENIYQNFSVPYSQDFYPKDGCFGGYLCNTAAFSPLIFPLFTSDIAITQMGDKLTFLLHQWQKFLDDVLIKNKRSAPHNEENGYGGVRQEFATLISAYIFAAYRLNKIGINQTILDKSVQLLLDGQNSSGLWSYNESAPDSEEDDCQGYCLGDYLNSRNHVILAAIGNHAIYLANPTGAGRCLNKAAKWLLQHQMDDGSWCQFCNPKYPEKVFTTVMVLDAIEMAEGGDNLTFNPNIQVDSNLRGSTGLVNKDVFLIDDKTHTILYQDKKIFIGGGGATWTMFKLLFDKKGKPVTHEEITEATGIHDVNKIRYDLCRSLRKKGAEELAGKIKNVHSVGYRLKM